MRSESVWKIVVHVLVVVAFMQCSYQMRVQLIVDVGCLLTHIM